MRYINIIRYVIIQLSSPKRIRHQKSWEKLSTSWIVWCTLTLRYFSSHVKCWCRARVSSPYPNSFSSSFVKKWTLGIFFPESIIWCNFFFESRFKTSTRFNLSRKKVEVGTCFVFKVSWKEVPWLQSIIYMYHIVGMMHEDNWRCCSIILSTSEMKFRFGSRSRTTSSTSSAARTLYVRNKKILRCHHCFWAYTDVTCVRIWLRNLTL